MPSAESPPVLPRTQWKSHPHYPSQVLLLGSHENFRRVSAMLIAAARAGEPPAWVRSVYEQWIRAMRSHEAYEERKLYPFLERRWQVSLQDSEVGHDELHRADEAVRTAFDDDVGIVEALERHDEVLRAHLEIEETQVIPLLLGLAPAEFESFIGAY